MKITRLINALDDRMNPLVVKELRQSARNKIFIVALTIFLGILLFFMSIIVADHNSSSSGKESLIGILGILLFVTMFFVPFYSAVRMAIERLNDNMDLLYITTLPSHKIVRGKFLAGMMLTLLFFSAALPFLCLTYFLRGVDLPTILLLSVFGFMIVGTLLQAALCMAALLPSRMGMILLGLFSIIPLFSIYFVTLNSMDRMNSNGVGYRFISGEYWGPVGAFLLIDLFVLAAFYKVNIALIKPQALDRAKPVRLFIFFGWVTIMTLFSLTSNSDLGIGWIVFGLGMTILGSLVAGSERDHPGRRILAEAPVNRFKRLLLFPFSSGAASGFTWFFIMLITIFIFIGVKFPNNSDLKPFQTLGLILNIFCYVLSAHFIQRKFLIHKFEKATMQKTWITTAFLFIFGSLIPMLVVFMFNGTNISESNEWNLLLLPSLALIFNNHFSGVAIGGAILWFLIMVVLEIGWFTSRFSEYMSTTGATSE